MTIKQISINENDLAILAYESAFKKGFESLTPEQRKIFEKSQKASRKKWRFEKPTKNLNNMSLSRIKQQIIKDPAGIVVGFIIFAVPWICLILLMIYNIIAIFAKFPLLKGTDMLNFCIILSVVQLPFYLIFRKQVLILVNILIQPIAKKYNDL